MTSRRFSHRICYAVVLLFVLAYLLALLLLVVGTYGWLGAEKDPLSGIFLIPLGLPWTMLLPASPTVGLFAPALNGLILWLLCKRPSR